MEAIYEEHKKRLAVAHEQSKNGQICGGSLKSLQINNIHYLFGALATAGFYNEAEKHVDSLLGTYDNKQNAPDSFDDPMVLAMFSKRGLKCRDPFACCTNLEKTKLMLENGLLNCSIYSSSLFSRDDEVIKFILGECKEENKAKGFNVRWVAGTKVRNIEMFKLALKHFGKCIIYDHTGINIYINNNEYMDIIEDELEYKYTDSDIKQITDLRELIRLRLKGYKIVNNTWNTACLNGKSILYDETEDSIIWKSAFNKKILEENDNDDNYRNNVLCYYLDTVKDPLDTSEYMEICEMEINNIVYKQYALYCLLYKFYDGLTYAISNHAIIDELFDENIHGRRIKTRPKTQSVRKFPGHCLMSIAITTMDLRAIELLQTHKCDLDIIVNNKDLLQIVFALPSQVAQQKIISLISNTTK